MPSLADARCGVGAVDVRSVVVLVRGAVYLEAVEVRRVEREELERLSVLKCTRTHNANFM